MTAASAKSIFGLDMARRQEKTSTLTDDKLAAMLAAARDEGRAEGRQEGERNAVAQAAQARQRAAETLLKQAGQLLAGMDTVRLQATGEAVDLGRAVAAKLAPRLIAREPAAELDALLAECMTALGDAPHLVIRCHPDLSDELREAAEAYMKTSGFNGRLVVMGEPDIALGDGRIEWAEGGIVRDAQAVMAQIDNCIQSYLHAKGVPAAGESEQ